MVGDMKKDGVKVRLIEQKELDAWDATTRYQDVQAAWVKEQEGKGISEARTVLEKVRSILSGARK